jgi:Mn2+/Fe2+ NRAMP family transporter
MKKITKIEREIFQFGIYLSVFLTLAFILILTPNYSYIDNFITYLMGVFSILLLLQMAYVEKLIKDKKTKDNFEKRLGNTICPNCKHKWDIYIGDIKE